MNLSLKRIITFGAVGTAIGLVAALLFSSLGST